MMERYSWNLSGEFWDMSGFLLSSPYHKIEGGSSWQRSFDDFAGT